MKIWFPKHKELVAFWDYDEDIVFIDYYSHFEDDFHNLSSNDSWNYIAKIKGISLLKLIINNNGNFCIKGRDLISNCMIRTKWEKDSFYFK
jgi:FPC/CPF motif-containing protein YcgG